MTRIFLLRIYIGIVLECGVVEPNSNENTHKKNIKIKINTRITMQLLVYKHLSNLCLLCVELTSNAFDHMNENTLLYLLLHLSYVFHLLVE